MYLVFTLSNSFEKMLAFPFGDVEEKNKRSPNCHIQNIVIRVLSGVDCIL